MPSSWTNKAQVHIDHENSINKRVLHHLKVSEIEESKDNLDGKSIRILPILEDFIGSEDWTSIHYKST